MPKMNESPDVVQRRPNRPRISRPRGKTNPTDIARWERDLECVRMRKAEMDWDTIVEKLGYSSRGHAHDRFIVMMRHYPRDDIEQMRDLELDRIEQACRELAPAIRAGGLTGVKAIEAWNKLSERRSKLMGLDKPERRELTVLSKDTVSAAIEKLNAELAAKAVANDVDLSGLID
jgi:hypothetical protein